MKISPPVKLSKQQFGLPARRAAASASGFSLAECLLAVSITATSLLGVIAMLAGAMSSARDSRMQTVSGMLVRQLAGEVRELARDGAEAPRDLVVLYDSAMQMMGHSRRDGSVRARYQTGSDEPAAATFVRLQREDDRNDPLLERVMITVETPAAAPAGQRKVLRYATLAAK